MRRHIPVSYTHLNLSGYTVESFVLDGRRLELTLAPYGPQAYGMVGLEIEPCGADGSPAYDEEQARTCIVEMCIRDSNSIPQNAGKSRSFLQICPAAGRRARQRTG